MTASAAVAVAPATVGEVLRGERGRDAVCDLLRHPGRYGASELRSSEDGTGLQLLRSKYKPGRNLRAYYRRPGARQGAGEEHWAVTWSHGSGDADPEVECLAFPVDPAMPQLEHLARVEAVVELTESLTGTRWGRSPAARVDPVRYRPGQRHVLVARLHSRPVYLKLDRDRSGEIAAPVAEVVQDALRSSSPAVRAATPIGFSGTVSAALWWGEQGQPLSWQLSAGAAAGPAAVHLVSAALHALHDRVGPPPYGTPVVERVHDADLESIAVLRAGQHVAALLPKTWLVYQELATEAATRLRDLPAGDLRFAHGDLKSENVLVAAGRPLILDFDRACWAEPAMDVGKLLADLTWWCGRDPGYLRAVRAALRAGYGSPEPVFWARVELWSVLFHLKFGARRCPLHERDWPARVNGQVERARGVLNGGAG